ncbi:MAG: alpha/beta hydrolase [Acidimicrobiia bacterium]|nr:alpha/beta hydrolase [Acidimicrobiia bacterium]
MGRRTLGPGELDLGVATLLYSGVPGWQELGSSLADAVEGDGEALLDASDWYVGRDPDGSYDNSQEAFWAIGCLDGGLAPDEIDAVAEQAATASPFFGPSTVYLGIVCTTWPYPAVEVPTVRGAGAPPIVVIGTTGDPATPLRWARALADQLESARLVVFEGEGHTAFPSFDGCLDGAVVDYLVDLVPPADGTTCP